MHPPDEPAPPAITRAWRLRRPCALTPRQVCAAFAAVCAVGGGLAAGFWAAGGLPIALWFLLELLVFGAALCVYARHAVDGETVRLDGQRLSVESDRGAVHALRTLDAAWLRVDCGADGVLLRTPGARLVVGREAPPAVRERFAAELRAALR